MISAGLLGVQCPSAQEFLAVSWITNEWWIFVKFLCLATFIEHKLYFCSVDKLIRQDTHNHKNNFTKTFMTCQIFLKLREGITRGRTTCFLNTEFITKGWEYCTDWQWLFICSSKMTDSMASFQNYHGTSLLFFFFCFSLFMLLAGDYYSLYSLAPTWVLFWMSCSLEVIIIPCYRKGLCHLALADWWSWH